MKLLICQNPSVGELWEQLPWVFLEQGSAWFVLAGISCSSPRGDCGSRSRLAFAIGSEHLVNGCKCSPLHVFAVAPSLKRAFVELSKYILSGVRATRLPGGDESAWVSQVCGSLWKA